MLHNRPLRVKNFVPYQPKVQVKSKKPSRSHSFFHRKSKKEEEEKEEESVETIEEVIVEQDDIASEPVEEPIEEKQEPLIPTSKDTLFISRLSPRINDADLREYFNEYNPTDIYIFKSRSPKGKRFFKHRHVSALVTLTEFETLDDVLNDLKEIKLKDKRIILKPAYLNKIDAVKKAALLRQKQLELQEQEAKGAASAALSLTASGETTEPTSAEVNEEIEEIVEEIEVEQD